MSVLDDIKPTTKQLVFDLVQITGYDMSDWISSSNNPQGPKANPKYCYEWAFVQPKQLVILNLWHSAMIEDGDQIVVRGNFRADAEGLRGPEGKPKWRERAEKIDNALQEALQDNLPIRVIINDGRRRMPGDPGSKASVVLKRELDPEPWSIVRYDWATGEHVLKRGAERSRAEIDTDVTSVGVDTEERSWIEGDKRMAAHLRTERKRSAEAAAAKRAQVRAANDGKLACDHCLTDWYVIYGDHIAEAIFDVHHTIPLKDMDEGHKTKVTDLLCLCANCHRAEHRRMVFGDRV
jgi:hypothetical protein